MTNTYYLINEDEDFDTQIKEMSSLIPYFQINKDQSLDVKDSFIYVYNYSSLGKSIQEFYSTLIQIMSHNNMVKIMADGTVYGQDTWEEAEEWMFKAVQLDKILRLETTNCGLNKARKNGVHLGRKAGTKNKNSLQATFSRAVKEMRKDGFTIKQISDTLHISKGTVSQILKQQ